MEECGGARADELLLDAARRIAAGGSGSPRLDAELILSHVLGLRRESLLANSSNIIEEKAAEAFREAVAKRARGLPVAYITGKKAFWRHEFEVTRDTLIPKPDTELLVERAGEAIKDIAARKEARGEGRARLLDMCAGSGCVAISLKFDFPHALVAGADISMEALLVAERNARKILKAQGGGEGIAWIRCDLREGIPPPPFPPPNGGGLWDIVAANPPYVPTNVAISLLADGRGEPLLALDGGGDGLSLIRPLVLGAAGALRPGGFLLVEAGEYNADETAACLEEAGFGGIFISRDLAGQKRVVEGRLAP